MNSVVPPLFSDFDHAPQAPSPTERARRLRETLAVASDAYYNHGTSPLSDAQYDALLRELGDLERAHPEVRTPDSPTVLVGAPVPTGRGGRTAHLVPMLSLPNAMSDAEVEAWHARMQRYLGVDTDLGPFSVEPKLDGNSFSVRYRGGRLEAATTRGNGVEGEDKTVKARRIRGLPAQLGAGAPPLFEVRGEVVLHFEDLEAINRQLEAEGEEPYDNVRNAAAGILNNEEENHPFAERLRFYAYGAALPGDAPASDSHVRLLDQLERWGFSTSPERSRCNSLDAAVAAASHILTTRAGFPFALDGAVIKVDSLSLQRSLGATGKDPRWAVARKERGEVAVTRLVGIDMGLGRTGAITPRALLEPVRCGGVMVSAATLHNQEEIQRLDLRLGDWVEIERAGEVIPKVLRVLTERRTGAETPWLFPSECPSCGGTIRRPVQQVKKGRGGEPDVVVYAAVHYCDHASCPAQRVRRIEHFASRRAMEIEGLGIKVAELLADAGRVQTVADLYDLSAEDLLQLDGFAGTRAKNLVEAIARSAKRPFHRVLIALGIRHVGETASELLARHFGSMDALLDASEEALCEVEGIGPTIARSWAEWASQEENRRITQRLQSAGLAMVCTPESAPAVDADGPFAGKTVVVTGKIEGLTREDVHARLRLAGAVIGSGISGSTSYLIAGEKAGSKRAKAEKAGVLVLSWEEALALLEG